MSYLKCLTDCFNKKKYEDQKQDDNLWGQVQTKRHLYKTDKKLVHLINKDQQHYLEQKNINRANSPQQPELINNMLSPRQNHIQNLLVLDTLKHVSSSTKSVEDFLEKFDKMMIEINQQSNINYKKQQIQKRLQLKEQPVTIQSIKLIQKGDYRKMKVVNWLSQVCREVFSITLKIYKEGNLSYSDMKIFCSQNLLENIMRLSSNNNLTIKDMEIINQSFRNQILNYYKHKYPPTKNKIINLKLKNKIKNFNGLRKQENDFIHFANIKFTQRESKNYDDLLMKLINSLILITKKQQKDKTYLEIFEEKMDSIFRIVQKPQNVAKKKSQDQKFYENYAKKVKQYTSFAIGSKIPKHVPHFTQNQIKNKQLKIRHSSILRVLIKWLDELWEILEKPQFIWQLDQLWDTEGEIHYLGDAEKQKIIQQLNKKKQLLTKQFKKIQQNSYFLQEYFNYDKFARYRKPSVPLMEYIVGCFSTYMVTSLHNYIINALNIIIHQLCHIKYSQEVGDIRLNRVYSFVSFYIADLFRCKFQSKQNQVLRVFDQLNRMSKQSDNPLQIIKINNRLAKGTNDILMIARISNKYLCQIQLSISQTKQTHSDNINKFNHFLYELSRAKFGPINQLCNIWVNENHHLPQFFLQILPHQQRSENYFLEKCECDRRLVKQKYPFICSCCKQFYSSPALIDHKICDFCMQFWKCAYCIMSQLDYNNQLKKTLFQEYHKQIEPVRVIQGELPQYGVYIDKNIRLIKIVQFKTLKIYNDIYVMNLQNDKINILDKIMVNQLNKFYKNKFVYSVDIFPNLACITQQKLKNDYLLPHKVAEIYKNKLDTISLVIENLTTQKFMKITQRKDQEQALNQYQRIKNLSLFGNKITEINKIKQRFTELESLDLSANNLSEIPKIVYQWKSIKSLIWNNNKIKQISPEINQLNSLERLILSNNFLQDLPIQKLQNLTQLNAENNQLTLLPENIGKLQKLKTINMNSNGIVQLPDSFYNLRNLQNVFMGDNKIKAIDPKINQLIGLQRLQLFKNQITVFTPEICDLSENLAKLVLSRNQIKVIPKEIAKLKKLQELFLNQNEIEEIPQQIGQLKKLHILSIRTNRLIKLPKCIGKLKNLEVLQANQNEFVQIDESLCQLQQLTFLDYSPSFKHNKKPPAQILTRLSELYNLKKLYINNFDLKEVPKCLCQIQTLQLLNLKNNLIQKVPQNISKLSRLVLFSLEGNNFSAFPSQILTVRYLKKMHIGKNKKKITLPENLYKLINLSQLRFQNSQLEQFPEVLLRMNNLNKLILKSNKLKQLPKGIKKLKQLKVLDIACNLIDEKNGYQMFQILPDKIQQLNISSNEIKTISEKITNFKQMTKLELTKNQLTVFPAYLGQLNKLINLDLSGNLFQCEILDIFSEFKFLQKLNISQNQLIYIPISVYSLKKLKLFNARKNKINQLDKKIEDLTNLQELQLSQNKLRVVPDEIWSLTKLKCINLQNNELQTISEAISNIPIKTEVNLSHNKFKTIPDCFENITKIKSVKITIKVEQILDSLLKIAM